MPTLKELQDVAEEKGREVFMAGGGTCLHCTLLSIQEAMKDVDDIEYATPYLIKATNALPAGIWAGTGPCGVVIAGAIALALKYGTGNHNESLKIWETGMMGRELYHWFKRQFGSCDCIDLSAGTDFSNRDEIKEWRESPRKHICSVYIKQGVRKIIDDLTKEDERVKR